MVLHKYNGDTDRCTCNGMVVYFEDGDKDGHHGEGCEVARQVFEIPKCDECGSVLERGTCPEGCYDGWNIEIFSL